MCKNTEYLNFVLNHQRKVCSIFCGKFAELKTNLMKKNNSYYYYIFLNHQKDKYTF